MNKKHKDGRIYSHGDGVSDTISPYAVDFWDNIEDDIKPLVQAFTTKGYLPYSSCSGHTYEKRRFIALAFNTKGDAQNLVDEFAWLSFVKWGVMIDFTIKHPVDNYEHDKEISESDQVNFLNQLYLRGYNEYVMLEISIGLNSHDDTELTKMKERWRDEATDSIIRFVEKELAHYGL